MIKKDPLVSFPFYCNQYLGMISKYTYEEQGAFIRAVATYIAEDGDISCETKESKYRLFSAFTEQEKKSIDKVFKDAVSLAKEIIIRQKQIRDKKRESGKMGGRPKANQVDNQMDNQVDNQMDNQMDNHKAKQTITYTETETETEKNTKKETIILHHDADIEDVNSINMLVCKNCGCFIEHGNLCVECEGGF